MSATARAQQRPARRRKAEPTVALRVVTEGERQPLSHEECRTLGHSWRHRKRPPTDEDLGFRRPIGAEHNALPALSVCSACGATRTKWVGRSGIVVSVYRYPEGYQRRGEANRVTPAEWRQAWYVRALEG